MVSKTCLNCSATLQGPYCSQCGQRADAARLGAGALWEDFHTGLLGINSGLLFTVHALLIAPAVTMRRYLEGKRANLTSPLTYVLSLSAAFILVKTVQRWLFQVDESRATQLGIENMGLICLCITPVLAYCYWGLFKKNGLNYWEHLAIQFFLAGQVLLYLVIINFLLFFFPEIRMLSWVQLTHFGLICLYVSTVLFYLHKGTAYKQIGVVVRIIAGLIIGFISSFIIVGMLITDILPRL